MTDAERYQRDYDRMIQEVEEKAALAQGTKNAKEREEKGGHTSGHTRQEAASAAPN
jgi:hypothetical protein